MQLFVACDAAGIPHSEAVARVRGKCPKSVLDAADYWYSLVVHFPDVDHPHIDRAYLKPLRTVYQDRAGALLREAIRERLDLATFRQLVASDPAHTRRSKPRTLLERVCRLGAVDRVDMEDIEEARNLSSGRQRALIEQLRHRARQFEEMADQLELSSRRPIADVGILDRRPDDAKKLASKLRDHGLSVALFTEASELFEHAFKLAVVHRCATRSGRAGEVVDKLKQTGSARIVVLIGERKLSADKNHRADMAFSRAELSETVDAILHAASPGLRKPVDRTLPSLVVELDTQ